MTTAGRARALLGIPYRPGGRNVETGLDCLGLVIAVFDLPDLASRARTEVEVAGLLDEYFRRVQDVEDGDLLVMRRGRRFHFAVCSGEGFVHADIRARRVVAREGALPWPLFGIYRRNTWPL